MGRFLYVIYDWTNGTIKSISYNKDKVYAMVGEDYLEGGNVEDYHFIEIDLDDENLLREVKEME